jgi:hypothetical protein
VFKGTRYQPPNLHDPLFTFDPVEEKRVAALQKKSKLSVWDQFPAKEGWKRLYSRKACGMFIASHLPVQFHFMHNTKTGEVERCSEGGPESAIAAAAALASARAAWHSINRWNMRVLKRKGRGLGKAQIMKKDFANSLDMKRAKFAAAEAARMAAQACRVAHAILNADSALQRKIWLARLGLAQKELQRRLGNSCPDVKVDAKNCKLELKRPLQFEGGKAQIVLKDLALMAQITKVLLT